MINVAIVGGAGFIGTRLSKRLKKKEIKHCLYDINVLKNEFEVKYLDVEDVKSLSQLNSSDILVNLAAEHRDDVYPIKRYEDVNIKGAINLCNAARKFGINKIIFTSSVAIYGFAPANTDENGTPNYFNEYGRTKYEAEQVFKSWQAEDFKNRTIVIIRPTVIFGEGNRGNVYNLLNQIATRKFIMFGSGTNKKSMAYVENVAAFIEESFLFEPGLHIFNYIDKPDFDMNHLVSEARKTIFGKRGVGFRLPSLVGILIGYFADLVNRFYKKPLPVSSIRVKKFLATTQFSSSVSETGFKPPVTLEEGLIKTLRYEFLEDNSNKRTFKTE